MCTIYIYIHTHTQTHTYINDQSQCPRGLRRGSLGRSLGGIEGSNPAGDMDVCLLFVVCCVLSRRGLGDDLITRPEESYRLGCVVECDQQTSNPMRLKPTTGL
jgi:hypothetical protein